MLLFSITIFLSAFLLFQIQPLISRYILSWFGGSSSVWSTAMFFFQALLLAGYAYAHWLSTRLDRRKQGSFHLALLLGSALFVIGLAVLWGGPLLPGAAWKPPDPNLPFLRITAILLVSVGIPYLLLSTTGPLLQAWFRAAYPSQSPYWLYALSNFGSLLALVTYPFLFEPLFSLKAQAIIWSGAYLGFILLVGFLALRARTVPEMKRSSRLGGNNFLSRQQLNETTPGTEMGKPGEELSIRRRMLWLAFPACSSILLLAFTNHLTQEVAVVPFLWIIPLSIYLISFMVAFSGKKTFSRPVLYGLLAAVTVLLGWSRLRFAASTIFEQVLVHSLFLLVAFLVCHVEVYRLRPNAQRLTAFYLFISLGGALGGLFVNLVAPLVFPAFWEYHLGVVLCWLLAMVVILMDDSAFSKLLWQGLAALLPASFLLLSILFSFRDIKNSLHQVLVMDRNFYGVYRVRQIAGIDEELNRLSLVHGITTHGFQFTSPERRNVPTAYYDRTSGIGLLLGGFPRQRYWPQPSRELRIGVIGLGIGTLASYGRQGDYLRFYEINPHIIALAEGKDGYFSFLADTLAEVDIVPGDARVSLDQELARGELQEFDVLVVDAFSGDSIPMHLLTAQAFELYLAHLKPHGILALHISNRFLDLTPVIYSLAEVFQMEYAEIFSSGDEDDGFASHWVLVSREPAFFELSYVQSRASVRLEQTALPPPWTDDSANLFQVLKTEPLKNWFDSLSTSINSRLAGIFN